MNIKQWVREARAHAGLTQEALGGELGVTKANVSAWETGRHEPSIGQMMRIAELTGFPQLSNAPPPKPPADFSDPPPLTDWTELQQIWAFIPPETRRRFIDDNKPVAEHSRRMVEERLAEIQRAASKKLKRR